MVPKSNNGLPLINESIFNIAEEMINSEPDTMIGPKTLEWWLAYELIELASVTHMYRNAFMSKSEQYRVLKSKLLASMKYNFKEQR